MMDCLLSRQLDY